MGRKKNKNTKIISIDKTVNKVRTFIKKEESKLCSAFFLFFRLLFSIFIVAIIPVIFFIMLIYIKPRNFPELNTYIAEKVTEKIPFLESLNIENAKLGLNKYWNLTYDVGNLNFVFEDNSRINLPNVTLEIDFFQLLRLKLQIEKLIVSDSKISLKLSNDGKFNVIRDNSNEESLDEILEKNNELVKKLYSVNFPINAFIFKNSEISIPNKNNFKIKITEIISEVKKDELYFSFNNQAILKFNNSTVDTKLNAKCDLFLDNTSKCTLSFQDLPVNSLKDLFKKRSFLRYYTENIRGLYTGKADFFIENYTYIKIANMDLFSPNGSFYLDKFFEKSVSFDNLNFKFHAEDNFDELMIESLTAKLLKQTDFSMTMETKKEDNHTDYHLVFKANNIFINNLNTLWPSSLNQNSIRDWVIEHVKNGIVSDGYADMNIKIYEEANKNNEYSELERIDSRIEFSGADLTYDDYFPPITNIAATAEFRKTDMDIRFISGNLLNSKVKGGYIKSKYLEPVVVLKINGKAEGIFDDLLAHINYKGIEEMKPFLHYFVNGDTTTSIVNIDIPIIENLSLKDIYINVKANSKNINSDLMLNNSSANFEFSKAKGSNIMVGSAMLDNAELNLQPLFLEKKKGEVLTIDYALNLNDDNTIEIRDISSDDPFLYFYSNGVIRNGVLTNLMVKDIKYDGFSYNLNYNKMEKNNKDYYLVNIFGEKMDLSNFILKTMNSFKSSNNSNKNNNSTNNTKLNISLHADIEKINIAKTKTIMNNKLDLICENGLCDKIEFSSNIDNGEILKISSSEKNGLGHSIKIESGDFGYLAENFGISDRLIGGKGCIEGFLDFNAKNIFEGKIEIVDKFSVLNDESLNKKILKEMEENQDFYGDMKDFIANNRVISFSKFKTDFKINSNRIRIENALASGSSLGLAITINGDVYFSTGEIDISGVVFPLEKLNSIFGINRLPIIGTVIFGEKDAGIFSSKYTYKKKNNDTEGVFKVSKASMIMPGIFREFLSNK